MSMDEEVLKWSQEHGWGSPQVVSRAWMRKPKSGPMSMDEKVLEWPYVHGWGNSKVAVASCALLRKFLNGLMAWLGCPTKKWTHERPEESNWAWKGKLYITQLRWWECRIFAVLFKFETWASKQWGKAKTFMRQFHRGISPRIFGKNRNRPRAPLMGPGEAIMWYKKPILKNLVTLSL